MPANRAHPAFTQPHNPAVPVWRYMDFAKYVAMMESACLHFSRLDFLGDPFEGSLSKAEFVRLNETAQKGEAAGTLPGRWKGKYLDVLLHSARAGRKQNYVSCWHINVNESEAMWRLYSQSGYAIAVQSTYVSPSAPNWFAELVSTVTKRYGYDLPVIKSNLSAAPYL